VFWLRCVRCLTWPRSGECGPTGPTRAATSRKFPERGKTRLITDPELKRLYTYLDTAEIEGLEHPFILLAVRLQFEFAARMSEIRQLQWAWVDLDNRRIEWPDSKTGGMSKPMSAEAARLFETAPRFDASPFVCPSIFNPNLPMSKHTYYHGWKRILERAGLPHIGTHGHPPPLGNRHRQFRRAGEGWHGADRA
jgi:integrase